MSEASSPPSQAPTQIEPTRIKPADVLEFMHPITWFPPMWAFTCGVVSSGQPILTNMLVLIAGVILAGPLLCATSQAVNDWFDRHVDAINEPDRPIPSGRIPGRWGLYIAIIWSAMSLLWSLWLGPWVIVATLLGIALAWAYSAPPARLKQNGWWGNAAVGFSYEGLAWVTGTAVMLGGMMPDWRSLTLAFLYSIGAHGIMTLNDFKAIEGDKQLGVRSLPVQLGADRAALLACIVMIAPQLIVIGLLFGWGQPWHGWAVTALVAGQSAMMLRFLQAPIERATWLSAFGVTLSVSGMMISAFAARALV
ncbi:chlorophyll synthase ChlG [Thiorhodovibrio frisius]|uniref:Bacteriochlorophyll/chlorophyll synthetase n=1 Tax=Thiorhodovibrio frisius TaxID=631362 RepID=H8Z4Q5_9GAMM|nr:chlorophyll synthase ChlG [Thiorhodovibrio frisius]EIC20312.1 bacteriochlorophyll/chlorophyll synthetase [Thiorhodovibrio frisius]WPL21050.1 bacteriochlorophyll synthase 33 kDa chain [Thiorhodovibrio frisius]